MASNTYKKKRLIFNKLSAPFWKREAVNCLLQSMKNIVAGTAIMSEKILSETCTECKIELPSSSPIIILQYDSKCDENQSVRMIPVIDYREMDENSGTVGDINIVNHDSVRTFDENFQEGIGIDNGIGKKRGNRFERNMTKEQHEIIHKRETSCISSKSGRHFTASYNLIEHESIHTVGKHFSCEEKCFTFSSNLYVHRRIHTGEKPFECKNCGRCFTRLINLTCHKRIHTGEKPFRCVVCYKSFSQSNSLIRHQRIHAGEKRYKCEQCDKSFTYLSNLIYHKRIHLGVKLYKCEICIKSFTNSYNLNCHKKIHS